MLTRNNAFYTILILSLLLTSLTSCRDDNNDTPVPAPPDVNQPDPTPEPEPFVSFELLDPTPGPDDSFGHKVHILENGNIVVSDPFDSSVETQNGAVHLFDPRSKTLLGSVYGVHSEARIGLTRGRTSITALANSNYIVSSSFDDQNGVAGSGSIRLIDGATGLQIGTSLSGDNIDDDFGSAAVTALDNSNYVITVSRDDVGGVTNAGSIRLINGATGVQIGDALVGEAANDLTHFYTVIQQGNNYIVATPKSDVNGMANTGMVRLMDGETGMQIGNTFAGDNATDYIGEVVRVLPNSNYVVASPLDMVDGINARGSVQLFNGSNAVPIGTALSGTTENDKIGAFVTALDNHNFVVISPRVHVSNNVLAGAVQLMDGATGEVVGSPIIGEFATDQVGSGGVVSLNNDNYVIISPRKSTVIDNVLYGDVGSVSLIDSSTGTVIGVVSGQSQNDQFGNGGVSPLSNGNYVIRSENETINGNHDAGSIRLIDGDTGIQLGTAQIGDKADDRFGSRNIIPLLNGNYVVTDVKDEGAVRLIDGTTGEQIGTDIQGVADPRWGNVITALTNSNYVVIFTEDDLNDDTKLGSVRLIDGTNGEQVGDSLLAVTKAQNVSENDLYSAFIVSSKAGDFYILSAPMWDNGEVNSGLVRLIAP